MYSFPELHGHLGDGLPNSFAYWLCRLRKKPKPQDFNASTLENRMSYHYEVEEQAYMPKMLNSSPDLIPKYLAPIAPVTLAYRWSPFPMAFSLLGKPEYHEVSDPGRSRTAFAVWKPKYLGADEIQAKTIDEAHFLFLLRLAASACLAAKCRVILVGKPGWSYEHAVTRLMNPDTAIMMHNAGYLFTDRVSR
jgi:hypothetical protein